MHGKAMSREKRAETFWEKVDKTPTCWLWKGMTTTGGYGQIDQRRQGVRTIIMAHRMAWELTYGPIPPGMEAMHGCDNPPCVRPDAEHVHLGTHAQNMAAMKARGRAANGWQKPNTKLDETQVRAIRKSISKGRELAKQYGVSEQTICDIRKRRTRSSIVDLEQERTEF